MVTGSDHGNPSGNRFPVQRRLRTIAEVGVDSHEIDPLLGAPHACRVVDHGAGPEALHPEDAP